jgi:hypothetical protein
MCKELYIAEVERIADELVETGMDADAAYELASERGWDAMTDRLADMADQEHDRQKEL